MVGVGEKNAQVRSKWGNGHQTRGLDDGSPPGSSREDDDLDTLKKETGRRTDPRCALLLLAPFAALFIYLIYTGTTPEQLKYRIMHWGNQVSQIQVDRESLMKIASNNLPLKQLKDFTSSFVDAGSGSVKPALHPVEDDGDDDADGWGTPSATSATTKLNGYRTITTSSSEDSPASSEATSYKKDEEEPKNDGTEGSSSESAQESSSGSSEDEEQSKIRKPTQDEADSSSSVSKKSLEDSDDEENSSASALSSSKEEGQTEEFSSKVPENDGGDVESKKDSKASGNTEKKNEDEGSEKSSAIEDGGVAKSASSSDSSSSSSEGKQKRQGAHVFISTDEVDLRPIFVVINSTLANAKHRDEVDFHLVIPEENEKSARDKLLPLFPGVVIDINRQKIDADRIKKLITYKEGSGARKELVSVFNFLPFYLPLISKDFERIVYLDADVVVVGDIGELANIDMEGKAAAAVEDCMQTFKTYFDFKQLAKIQARKDPTKPWMPHFLYDKKACVFNRGVLMMDVKKWIDQNMTETIEWWMKEFNSAKEPLYRFGLSQPPFLLTMYTRYKKLDRCWNTRGLGRDAFGEKERDFLARIGFGRPPKSPFLSPWADSAKIMHFNGKWKPWRSPRIRPAGEEPKSLCGERRVECAKYWWQYISDDTMELLKPPEEEAGEAKE